MSHSCTHLLCQRSKASRILARMTAALRSGFWPFTLLECVKELCCELGCKVLLIMGPRCQLCPNRALLKTHVEVISNHKHRRIAASTLAFDLYYGKFAVLRCLARLDATEVLANSVEDIICSTQHARGGCANLHEVLSYRFATFDHRRKLLTQAQRSRSTGTHRLNMV